MSLKEEKLQIVDRIIHTDDATVIRKVKKLLDAAEKDFWDELPAHVKASVERGLKDVKEGRVKSHEEVFKKYRKWLIK